MSLSVASGRSGPPARPGGPAARRGCSPTRRARRRAPPARRRHPRVLPRSGHVVAGRARTPGRRRRPTLVDRLRQRDPGPGGTGRRGLAPRRLTRHGDRGAPWGDRASRPPVALRRMEGYSASSYGDGFADVYDTGIPARPDDRRGGGGARRLAGGGPVLELGCGTGRLCLPLADARSGGRGPRRQPGHAGPAAAQAGADRVTAVEGDMADFEVATPPGRERSERGAAGFRLVFVAFNTFFNLASERGSRAACCGGPPPAARRAAWCWSASSPAEPPPTGPDADRAAGGRGRPGRAADQSRQDPAARRSAASTSSCRRRGGVRLRPWHLRYAPPGRAGRAGRRRPGCGSSSAGPTGRARRSEADSPSTCRSTVPLRASRRLVDRGCEGTTV